MHQLRRLSEAKFSFIWKDIVEYLRLFANRSSSHLLNLQVMTICRDFGVVCIRREGQDVDKIICNDDILSEYKVVVVPCGAFLFCFFFFLLLLICFYGASIRQILAETKCLYFKVSSLMGLNQVLEFHLHGRWRDVFKVKSLTGIQNVATVEGTFLSDFPLPRHTVHSFSLIIVLYLAFFYANFCRITSKLWTKLYQIRSVQQE